MYENNVIDATDEFRHLIDTHPADTSLQVGEQSNQLTLLTATGGEPGVGKRFKLVNGQLVDSPRIATNGKKQTMPKWFVAEKVGALSCEALAKLLQDHAHNSRVGLVRGIPEEEFADEDLQTRVNGGGKPIKTIRRRKSTIRDHESFWLPIDLDSCDDSLIWVDWREAPDTYIRELIQQTLPEEFWKAGCAYQFSSSHGIKNGARVHLYFRMTKAVTCERLQEWYDRVPELAKNKVDRKFLQREQIQYIAAPEFLGKTKDPISQRVGMLKGGAVELVIPDEVQDDASETLPERTGNYRPSLLEDGFSSKIKANELLTRFGYKKSNGKWIAPESESGQAGVSVSKQNGKEVIFSHHQSDVLFTGGNKCHNTYQAFCLLYAYELGVAADDNRVKNEAKLWHREKSLDVMNSELVFIEDGCRVADLSRSVVVPVFKQQDFSINFREKGKVYCADHLNATEFLNTAWLNWPGKRRCLDTSYFPGAERVFTDSDTKETYCNTFWTPKHKVMAAKDYKPLLGRFHAHIRYLFPEDDDRKLYIRWLAETVHNPGLRLQFVLLHISRAQGTGRGWLDELIQKLIGNHNFTKTDMPMLAGKGSQGQFMDYLHSSLYCSIAEAKGGSIKDRYEFDDKIRDKLIASVLYLPLKYEKNGMYKVFANMALFSNSKDALVLPPDDRRMWVVETQNTPQDKPYYDALYGDLDRSEYISAVYSFLADVFKRYGSLGGMTAPKTDARARLIDDSKTDLTHHLDALLDNPPAEVMLFKHIESYLEVSEAASGSILNKGELQHLLKERLHTVLHGDKVKVSANEGPSRVWIMSEKPEMLRKWSPTKPSAKTKAEIAKAVRQELTKLT